MIYISTASHSHGFPVSILSQACILLRRKMYFFSSLSVCLWAESHLIFLVPLSISELQGTFFPFVSQYPVLSITVIRYPAGKYHHTTHLGFPPTAMWACGEESEEEGCAPGLVLMCCWESQRALPRLSWDVLLLNCSSDRTVSYDSYKLFTVFAAPQIYNEFHHCAVKCPYR